MVLKLKNTSAELVAVSLNDFLQSQRDLASIDPELVSNVELLEQEIIVVAEPVSNSLLISTTPRYRKEILDIIETLDEAPDQVIIQVLIVEVVLENTDEFGVELGFQDSVLFDRSLINVAEFLTIDESTSVPATGVVTTTQRIVSQEGVPGFLFNNNQLGNNISPSSNAGHVASQGLSSFSLGRINGDLGFGGLVVSASSEAVSVLIRALSARREVQILSRPQIRTVDNQLAQIQVGQQVPVIQGVTTNALGGISPAIGEPEQIGIILQVTPRITPDGVIVMETIANKSAISGQGVPIITDPTTGAVVESPIFDVTEASATVAVPDGQTIVLGGMITKSDDILERKVPLLGDIPILGAAFRYDGKSTRRTELLIFMTPRIIRTDVDSELIKQVEIQRLHFLECEAEAMHGPISAVPPIGAYEGETIEVLPEGEIIPGHQGYDLPLPEEVDGIPTTVMPKLHDPGASYRVIQPHEGAAGSTEQPDGTSPANTEDQSSNIHRPDMMGSRAVISQSGATPQPGASLQPGRYPVAPAQYQGTSADRPAPVQQTGLQMPIAQGVQRATPNAKGRVDDSRPLVPRLEQELLPVANATGPQTSVRGPARFLPSNRTAASEPSSAGRNVPTGQTPR
jgi:Flp pilus assembly secretin CpaC